MAVFHLIRHGHMDGVRHRLSGRQAGVHLSEQGRRQVDALARWAAEQPIRGVYASPLERVQETARPLAERLNLRVETAEELIELDFGEWTGRSFDELENDPRWKFFNTFRSGVRIPGGETMLDVQARAVGFMQRLRETCPDDELALVTHGDVIRASLCYWLGMSLDLIHRLEVEPASISTIRLKEWGATIASINAKLAEI